MNRVIGLVGQAGSGKDTVAHFLAEQYGYHPIALATPLKDFIDPLLGAGKHRRAYQQVGDVMRQEDPLVFIKAVQRQITQGLWVITDIRYLNEALAFPEAALWFIAAPYNLRVSRLQARDGEVQPRDFLHRSEQDVEALRDLCSVILENDGDLPTLYRQIQERMDG